MSAKEDREILGLHETGSEEYANASEISASDLIWGLYGIGHIFAKAAEHEETDVAVGLGLAAQSLSKVLVDRMSIGRYVAKPNRRARPSKVGSTEKVTPEQIANVLAFADHLKERYGKETSTSPDEGTS